LSPGKPRFRPITPGRLRKNIPEQTESPKTCNALVSAPEHGYDRCNRIRAMAQGTERHFHIRRAGRWAAELLLVFVGVYAAFWLGNYQEHRQEAKRRQRILATLEEQLRKGIESGRIDGATQEREQAGFQRALNPGEMPPLHPFVYTTDYSPGDISALLQAGGVELLDVKTVVALRQLESVIRLGLSDLERYQKLSDALIAQSRPGYLLLS
jgi:hypothetical protein